MGSVLGHEKLRVYQRGLDYATWTHAVLAGIEPSVAALDHWDRAAESIVENLACRTQHDWIGGLRVWY